MKPTAQQPIATPLVVIDSHTKPGCWLLTKYKDRELIDRAEIPCTQHTAAELMAEIEPWRVGK